MQILQQIRDATPRALAREQIQRLIAKRRAQRGDKLPTYAELCTMLGFSLLTVQRAMGDLAKQGQVYRLHGKGCYVGRPAKGIAGTMARIGLIHNASLNNLIDSPYLNQLLSGMLSACAKREIDLTILSLKNGKNRSEVQALTSQHDALVLLGVVNETYVSKLIATGLPLVLVDNRFTSLAIDTVVIDNHGAVQSQLLALMALGHRRIAYVSGRTPDPFTGAWIESSDETERLDAYTTMMTESGRSADMRILKSSGKTAIPSRVLLNLARSPRAPTAYLASSAGLAVTLHRQLTAAGCTGPNAVSLAAVAGVPADVGNCPINLDYGQVDFRAMGAAAIETLERRCNRNAPTTPVLVRIGVERMHGCSMAAPGASQ